jgi:hypothetical protein
MADEPKPDPAPEPKGEEGTQTLTQAEVDKVVADRLARERAKYADYDDLKARASKLDELESANQSELEKLTGKVASLTDENKGTKAENLRLRVALAKGLTGDKAELADRLRGDTQEELEADADKLLSFVSKEPEPKPDFGAGVRDPAPEPKTPEQAANETILGLLGAVPQQT